MNPIFSLRLQILCGLFVHLLCGLEALYVGNTRPQDLTGMLAYPKYFRGNRHSKIYSRPICKCSESLVQPRIVGGEQTKEGEFPFAVSIEGVVRENQYEKELITCGGTLITNKHVITAAHCFNELNENSKITLYVGEYDHKNRKKKEIRKSVSYYIHPKYTRKGDDYDVAIIELDFPVYLGYNYNTKMDIRAAYLPPRHFHMKPETMLTVIGWGHVAPEEENEPTKLRSVEVPLASYEYCEHIWRTKIRKEAKFCAGGVPDHDACQGDSGSGIFLPIRGIYTVVGIVSYGKSCGLPMPAIYTNLTSFVDFIYDKTRSAGCSPCLIDRKMF